MISCGPKKLIILENNLINRFYLSPKYNFSFKINYKN